jgi:hypothetical protein
MSYKILVDNNGRIFTYEASHYDIDDYFITFVDKMNIKRKIPKHRLIEIIE